MRALQTAFPDAFWTSDIGEHCAYALHYLEIDETVHEAAIRETLEETGLLVEPGEIVGLYTRLEASVVTIAFEARIVGGTAAPTTEATEIVAYAPADIPWPEIAFTTTHWALRDWLGRRHPDLRAPAHSNGM